MSRRDGENPNVHDQAVATTEPEKITFDREEVVEIAEILASALHHENIGREIAGWREVSEAFAIVKGVLDATR